MQHFGSHRQAPLMGMHNLDFLEQSSSCNANKNSCIAVKHLQALSASQLSRQEHAHLSGKRGLALGLLFALKAVYGQFTGRFQDCNSLLTEEVHVKRNCLICKQITFSDVNVNEKGLQHPSHRAKRHTQSVHSRFARMSTHIESVQAATWQLLQCSLS